MILLSDLGAGYRFKGRKLEQASQLHVRIIASFALSASALVDVSIAAALTVFLRRLKSGFKKSDSWWTC